MVVSVPGSRDRDHIFSGKKKNIFFLVARCTPLKGLDNTKSIVSAADWLNDFLPRFKKLLVALLFQEKSNRRGDETTGRLSQ